MTKICKHIYVDAEQDPCELCGKPSHITDWEYIAKVRREHRKEKGLFYIVREWWSI